VTKFIHIDQVLIAPTRQRTFRSEQDHQDLLVSISEGEAGLIHAPMLWKDGDKFWLVAGEGRLKVIREMNELGMPLRYEGEVVEEGMIPYTLIGGATPAGRYEAEFDENVRRTQLTVAERASATACLFELKRMKAEQEGLPAPTIQDLAMDINGSSKGDYQTNIRKELIVARHLDDPEVRKATSVREAFNVIKKKETQRKASALAVTHGAKLQTGRVELLNVDATEWVKAAPASRYDIVLSDPIYGMGADTFGTYAGTEDRGTGPAEGHAYDDSYEAWVKLMEGILPHLSRICKPDAHLYLFCDFDRFHEMKFMLAKNGWEVHRTPIIWHNPTGFRTPWPDSGPQRKWELVLYAKRGAKKTLKVYPDLITCSREKDSIHQAQKPLALIRDLLSRSALPTDEVLDFCAGSAGVGVVCHEMKLACTCLEVDHAAYARALQRLQTLKV
jgi:DNA modification methylase